MKKFTLSLPKDLLHALNHKAEKINMPTKQLLEIAVTHYLTGLNKAEYAKSYQSMRQDADVLDIAEEGLADFHLGLLKIDKQA